MSFREQKKLLEELKRFEPKMEPKDKEAYKMFIKREKDEEDFDTISMARLREMHQKYFGQRPKPDINSLFKS